MKKHFRTRQTLTIFWRYTTHYKRLFWLGTIGAILGVISQDIIPPFIISRAFIKLQSAYVLHRLLSFDQFGPYLIVFIAFNLMAVVFWRLQTYAVWEFETRTVRDMIIDIFDHLQRLGQKFHSDRFGGAMVSQANKFVGGYEKFMDEMIWSVLAGVVALLFSLTVLVIVSWQFALIMLIVVAIYLLIMGWRVKITLQANRRAAETESTRTASLADTITNVGNVRAFANEDYELKRFGKVAEASWQAYHELSIADFKNSSISHTITSSFRIIAFLFGVFAVTSLHANASVLYLVISYTTSMVDRLWQFSRVARNISRALGDASEMTTILLLPPEIIDNQNPLPVTMSRGAIEFRDIGFSHHRNSRPLFQGLSLRIKPGEKVGLVGKSGGGKTTLTSLLLRYVDVQSGQIMIDGQDITSVKQTELRQQIAYVPQEPILFHRTLSENIRYGNLSASDREIEAISRLANADGFISELPQAYDTLVGERGIKLSGGQRQRVAIARAMLKNAPILVLDEATSALDSESELLVQDALWKLMEGRTAIVIAHRLSTIQKMDRIVVLNDGSIIEQGTHKELLRLNGSYAKLWAHQSGGFMED
ncbi:MAG TPA: ABC transporter ATP-binding protein [Candidatus Dormibacteraeota bacterium]|nr:ABC transporter ATP-binding protein [Candidatus Dormibacteraeota bacterium]